MDEEAHFPASEAAVLQRDCSGSGIDLQALLHRHGERLRVAVVMLPVSSSNARGLSLAGLSSSDSRLNKIASGTMSPHSPANSARLPLLLLLRPAMSIGSQNAVAGGGCLSILFRGNSSASSVVISGNSFVQCTVDVPSRNIRVGNGTVCVLAAIAVRV